MPGRFIGRKLVPRGAGLHGWNEIIGNLALARFSDVRESCYDWQLLLNSLECAQFANWKEA